jgi:hypothetical protein
LFCFFFSFSFIVDAAYANALSTGAVKRNDEFLRKKANSLARKQEDTEHAIQVVALVDSAAELLQVSIFSLSFFSSSFCFVLFIYLILLFQHLNDLLLCLRVCCIRTTKRSTVQKMSFGGSR